MRTSLLVTILLVTCTLVQVMADPPAVPPVDTTAKDVAADGTVSVVVDPPARPTEPPTAPGLVPPPPAALPPGAASPPPAADVVQPFVSGPAADLLGRALEPPAAASAEAATSRPLPLIEALERSGDRSRRLWITQAYWKVSAACAHVRFAAEAVERLDLVAPGAAAHERAVLDAATAAARADLADARADLSAAQQELYDLVRLPIGEPLPWPVDRPLVTPYQTHFDTIFASRPATGRTRAIHRLLPSRHEAIQQRASAATSAAEAFRLAEADHAKGQRPIESVVAAHTALAESERAFATALRAYNADIAEYAMAVADLSLPDDRFAMMLIGTPTPWQPPAPVQPAGLVQPPGQPPAAFVPVTPSPGVPVSAP
jgi:hypothetical protein